MPREIKKLTPKKSKDVEIKDRRKKFIFAGAAGAAVLCAVLVAVFLVGGGPQKMSAQEATTQPATAQSEKKLEDVMVPPLSVYRKRNPFQPLRNEKATIEAGVPGTATMPPAGGGAVVAPPELTGGGPQVVSTVVALEDIYEENGTLFARIRVGDQVFDKVSAGQVFGDYYKVLALQDRTATILYGDEQFSFFEGQSIYW